MKEAFIWLLWTFVSTLCAICIFDSILSIGFLIAGLGMATKALIADYISR